MADPINANWQEVLFVELDAFSQVIRSIELLCSRLPLTAATETSTDNPMLLNTTFNNMQNRSTCSVRLPKLITSKLSCDTASWLHFADLFGTLVHKNDELLDIEKLQYIKSNLLGESLNLIALYIHHVDNILTVLESTKFSLDSVTRLVNTLSENVAVERWNFLLTVIVLK